MLPPLGHSGSDRELANRDPIASWPLGIREQERGPAGSYGDSAIVAVWNEGSSAEWQKSPYLPLRTPLLLPDACAARREEIRVLRALSLDSACIRALGADQPRLSDLRRGRLEFSPEPLLRFIAAHLWRYAPHRRMEHATGSLEETVPPTVGHALSGTTGTCPPAPHPSRPKQWSCRRMQLSRSLSLSRHPCCISP